MLERRGFYLLEGFKSMLIFLLVLFTLFLAAKAFWPYQVTSAAVELDALLDTGEVAGGAGVSRPVRMVVTNARGRLGAQYDDETVDALFDRLGSLLGEALDSVGDAVPAERADWERALSGRSVYYEFPGRVSLRLLAAWLGEAETAPDVWLSRLVLAETEEGTGVRLCYEDADSGQYYICSTSVRFRQRLEEYAPNGALFAFQDPDRYGALAPDTLILPQVPAPPVYESDAGVNVQNDEALENLLDALSFSPQPSALYPSAEGWNVREAEDNLRLTRSGNIYYHSGETSDRYPLPEVLTASEAAEVTGALIRAAVTPNCGAARVCLDRVEETPTGWILTYRYVLSGADVQLGQDGWCARFVLENGRIREYTLKLRRYERTDSTALLLPEYQAMHAMQAMQAGGRQLLLRYSDNGTDAVSPAWIAR